MPTTKRSCRKETLILTYVTRYEALKRILVILSFFKVNVTAMVMNHLWYTKLLSINIFNIKINVTDTSLCIKNH